MGQNVKKELLDGKVKIIVSFPRLEMSCSLSFWKVHQKRQGYKLKIWWFIWKIYFVIKSILFFIQYYPMLLIFLNLFIQFRLNNSLHYHIRFIGFQTWKFHSHTLVCLNTVHVDRNMKGWHSIAPFFLKGHYKYLFLIFNN